MAGVIIPRASLRPLLSSPCELRALPILRGRLLPINSRASTYWSAARALQRPCIQLSQRERWNSQIRRDGLFSTSALRRAEPENGEKGSKDPLGKEPSPKSLSSLKDTLKTKIPKIHEDIYNLPNMLTFSRLLATPAIGYLIIQNAHLYAFGLFLYAGFSDLLDGWIARRWNLQTVVGSVVDPMADKALMTTLVSCLAVNGSLSLPLATIILGRDASLAVAALYYRYASLPQPKTMRRYWDFSLPSAEVHPTTVSKANTFLQLVLIGTTMCVSLLHDPSAMHSAAGTYLQSVQTSLGGPDGVNMLVNGMSAVVASTTVWSGMSYAFMKDAVKILGENEEVKRKQGVRGRMIIGGCFGSCIAVAGWLAWRQFVAENAEGETD